MLIALIWGIFVVELAAKCGLILCSAVLYVPIIARGLLYQNKRSYGSLLFLLLFTVIFNYYLKSLWQSPLPPPMKGWAFPSGHMQSAVIFWGWLACVHRRLWFFICVFFILALAGFGLVYEGYHYFEDIFGALIFGTLTLIIYYVLNMLNFLRDKNYLIGIFLFLVGLKLIILLPPEARIARLWLALSGLVGLSAIWRFLEKRAFLTKLKPSESANDQLRLR